MLKSKHQNIQGVLKLFWTMFVLKVNIKWWSCNNTFQAVVIYWLFSFYIVVITWLVSDKHVQDQAWAYLNKHWITTCIVHLTTNIWIYFLMRDFLKMLDRNTYYVLGIQTKLFNFEWWMYVICRSCCSLSICTLHVTLVTRLGLGNALVCELSTHVCKACC